VRAAEHGRSTEAEIRDTLEKAARPEGRVRLGSLLAAIGREAALTNENVEAIQLHRDQTPSAPRPSKHIFVGRHGGRAAFWHCRDAALA